MRNLLNTENGFFTSFRMTAIFLFLTISLLGQSLDPTKLQFTFKKRGTSTDTTGYLSSSYFKQDKFLWTFQWGGHTRFINAMGFTGNNDFLAWDGDTDRFLNDAGSSNKMMAIPVDNSSSFPYHFFGIEYEPTLQVSSADYPLFHARLVDTTRQVFGFEKVYGTIFDTGTNLSRLVLDSLKYKDSIILKNQLPDGHFVSLEQKDLFANSFKPEQTTEYKQAHYGQHYYLSINLRRTDSTDYSSDNEQILKLKIRYITTPINSWTGARDTGYIRFKTKPIVATFDSIKYNNSFRGLATKQSYLYNKDSIIITRSMLPTGSNDVTISSMFVCDNNTKTTNPIDSANNYYLHKDLSTIIGTNQNFYIDKLQIEVTYLDSEGNTKPIGIDWVRIESPDAQNFLRGRYDSVDSICLPGEWNPITHVIDESKRRISIKTRLQKMLDTLGTTNNYEFFRVFAGSGLDDDNIRMWRSYKYLAKLVGDVCTFSCGGADLDLKNYTYYVDSKDFWGFHQSHKAKNGSLSVPYYRGRYENSESQYHNAYNYRALGYKVSNGFRSLHRFEYNDQIISTFPSEIALHENDSLNSAYETFIKNDWYINTFNKISADTLSLSKYYQDIYFLGVSNLTYNETGYSKSLIENKDILFSGTPLWSQQFTGRSLKTYNPIIDLDSNSINFNRTIPRHLSHQNWLYQFPQTGETMSHSVWKMLIVGVKGFCFDKSNPDPILPYNAHDTILDDRDIYLQGIASNYNGIETASYDSIVYSNQFGGDFLKWNDPENVSNWVNKDSIAHYLQVTNHLGQTDTNRIYMGHRSPRIAIKQITNLVNQNNDYIMSLKLQAWNGIGFRDFYLQHPDYTKDSIIRDYVRIDSIKTRKLWQPTRGLGGDSTYVKQIAYESRDSSFYDISLLKHGTKAMDSAFTIGIVNRRTDPLVFWNVDGSHKFTRFIATAEFVDSMTYGNRTSLYRDFWWKKFGARELTIPFNFRPKNGTTLDSNKYCLLRVREVYDTLVYSKNVRSMSNTKLIDTIIGQDSRLVVDLQPGEGKFLKVEVIYPPDSFSGDLSKSNQHKLVCVPMINSNGQEIDSVVYFATYHRKEGTNSTDTTKVFLRVSYPIKKDSSGAFENIRWRNEIQVSKNIAYYLNGQSILALNPLTCQYPSLVAQKDSLNGNSGYFISVVYACDRKVVTNQSFDQFIAYTLFKYNSSTQIISTIGNNARFNVCGESKEYGHPVINASKNNNFVAFSDSLGGIIYSAFAKNQYSYLTLDSVNCQPNYFMFQNPSFNAYSNLVNGDTTASLVWTGRTKIGALLGDSYPFYTRVKLDSIGNVTNYIPKFSEDTTFNFINWGYELIDSTYIKFIWGGRAARYPVVYKVVRPTLNHLSGEGNEYLSWQRSYENDTVNFLFNLKLGFAPSHNLFGVNNHFTLVVQNVNDFGFTHPNIAQKNGRTGYDPTPNSEAVLNFTYNQNIWQKPLTNGVFNKGVYQSVSQSTLTPQFEKLASGDFSHLSMSPKENDSVNMWKNRRIYNDNSQTNIYTSAKMFYKVAIGGGTLFAEGYVGYECDTANYYIQFPLLNGNDLNLFLPYKNSFDSTLGNILVQNNLDTIKSEWFTIGTSEYLQLKSFGTLNANCMLFIQRQDSNAIYPITYTRSGSEWLTAKLNITLTNGGGHNYRLVLKRIVDSTYHYMERVVFGELDIASNLNLKSNSNVENQVINMMTGTKAESIYNIIAMPNPAENDVKLMFTVPNTFDSKTELNNVNLEIINQVGKVVMSKSTNSNQIEQINLKDFNQGVYFVRATFVNNITKAIEETKLIPLYIVR